ncbi:MAG: YfcE family phosphodiesterase [Epsilonproteobacteria bacterium]|nr:YfcE family phosphodiesterase [Campylobacterota bacterium]NPA88934.1 YfcE family phosphodiesterase [Campylobacterota bacterium]
MKVGIFSDTHKKVGRAKRLIDKLLEEGAESFVVAGDIVKIEVLDYLEEIGKPYVAVLGNNDYHLIDVMDKYSLYREPHYFKLGEKRAKVMHFPHHIFPLDTDIIIYGHTHSIDISFNGRNLILNPGEACARDTNYSSGMVLDILPGGYRVHLYYRKIKTQIWKEVVKEFKL